MTKNTDPSVQHLSSSTFQGEVEHVMLTVLGKELGVALVETSVNYHGAKMKVDGVDPDQTVFVEAFAHAGIFKSGQRRKIATDALKFVALQGEHPDAHFILAFADSTAMNSVTGWVKAVIDHHGIKLTDVDIPGHLLEKLATVQADQKSGMEAAGDGGAEPPE